MSDMQSTLNSLGDWEKRPGTPADRFTWNALIHFLPSSCRSEDYITFLRSAQLKMIYWVPKMHRALAGPYGRKVNEAQTPCREPSTPRNENLLTNNRTEAWKKVIDASSKIYSHSWGNKGKYELRFCPNEPLKVGRMMRWGGHGIPARIFWTQGRLPKWVRPCL